jgi:hypothetical protein
MPSNRENREMENSIEKKNEYSLKPSISDSKILSADISQKNSRSPRLSVLKSLDRPKNGFTKLAGMNYPQNIR